MHEHHMEEQAEVRLRTKNNSPIISVTSEGRSKTKSYVSIDDKNGDEVKQRNYTASSKKIMQLPNPKYLHDDTTQHQQTI